MADDRSVIMQLLAGHAGTWVGSNRFRLMPTDPPAEAAATAQLSLGAGGHLAVLSYTWTHPADGPQEGLLVVGAGEEPDTVVALWADSWHQKPAAAQLRGSSTEDAFTVGYAYAEGWEWRITLGVDQADRLRWRMDNVVPPSASAATDGQSITYWAMDAELRRG